MHDPVPNPPPHEGHHASHPHHARKPSWKRPHHDWRFWAALFGMLLAMVIYVTSQDLAWMPRGSAAPKAQHP